MNPKIKKILIGILTAAILTAAVVGIYGYAGQRAFISTLFSGLTLGSLFFMVAAGLTLIFGLMDVLNFAHGSMFMLGAYIGWQFYTNPTFIFGMAPFFLAFAAGVMVTPIIKPYLVAWNISEKWQKALPNIIYALALVALVFAFVGFDILSVADTAMVAATTTTIGNPLAEISAQEPLSTFWLRPVLMFVSGLLIAVASSRPGDKTQFAPKEPHAKKLLMPAALLALTLVSTLVRESASVATLLMNGNLRFALSILLSVAFGFVFGAVLEMTLIRPLYVRPTFIILMTLGLSYVIRELVQYLWDPLTYQMSRPPLFAQPGKAANIMEWLQKGSATIDMYGATVPTYRLFIIALGIVMFIVIVFIMTKTRLGMIIRAGVQDPQMVEAMGINVKAVFTLVFAMGVALAALGGIGAAPFLPVQPLMGDTYQTQGLITVVIGGMGSYIGAFVGAMILGMARAFGDYFALKLSLSPAIAEASTVIIMVIVLLTRPQGLFGKKE
ncbi:MAG TPA: branched-chain amino acid ABC transporter permease [Anaerolineaceae bacterium]|jgi:branched-chain amino acid transport system permease protein|nr:branched-chain amino acid ABC transporter permease [Anaerolineales bacterium]HQC21859.1 branched-chain amino acid ABC transporter permease [Anaerolineaceae bacterium]HQK42240.1 branched-chain amino acid ABC transporter permease [Anaerolineaceae bacterium]